MRPMMRLAGAGLAALTVVVAAFAGAGSAPGAANAATTTTVNMKSFQFSPATVSIDVGDTVRWLNNEDSIPHTATSEAYPGFATPVITAGETASVVFDKAGAYPYFCLIHPGMRGVVLVVGAAGTPGARPAAVAQQAINLRLTGAEEVPAVNTPANGAFAATADANSVRFQLQAVGVGMTMAHIHQGAKGANGPVVAFLFGPNPAGQNAVDVSGTIREADLVGPLRGDMRGFQAALAAGNLYVNVHTVANAGGEVRAQIPPAPAPRPPSTGSGLAMQRGDWALYGLLALLALAAVTGGVGAFARGLRQR